MAPRNLPVGIQDFEVLRNGNYIYVDKTRLIYNLVQTPVGYYFLSRPRRFGKSLLVSTLACLFEGRQDLFTGLWLAGNTGWQWTKHPVIIIDFNNINHQTPPELEKSILARLAEIAGEYQLPLERSYIPNTFATLILNFKKKYNLPVVVLIDEYDKAIISHLGKGETELQTADKNREILKQLFGVLKAQAVAGSLRFVFLTGVSKFTQVSVFSDLNNLEDLTMQQDYCDLAGYTENELQINFKENIDNLSTALHLTPRQCREKLRHYYNGYRFTEKDEKVYNPFSILCVLKTRQFKNYWFETGTPAFLLNLIKERNYYVPAIEQLELRESAFTKYEIASLSLEALLFQTGYITIDKITGRLYSLRYPNQEVKNSFIDYLYEYLVIIPDNTVKNRFTLLAEYLRESKFDEFFATVNIILSAIPYTQLAGQGEAYYHTAFYLMLAASGVEVLTEVLTSRGRIDLAVFFADKIYIIELKCNQDAERAIRQIRTNRYADKYRRMGKQIILMGINFDPAGREIRDWKSEVLHEEQGK